jgi:hypothetical protein
MTDKAELRAVLYRCIGGDDNNSIDADVDIAMEAVDKYVALFTDEALDAVTLYFDGLSNEKPNYHDLCKAIRKQLAVYSEGESE